MRMPLSRRAAVSLLFLLNGYIAGSWAPKIPEFAARAGLSESGLGVMFAAFGVGSLIAMPLVGAWIARGGSRHPLFFLSIGTALALAVVSLPQGWAAAFASMLYAGIFIGGMDVAMNANAVAVEKRLPRAIMSSCHGFWSLGGLIGSATGGWLIATVGAPWHAVLVTGVALTLAALALPRLLDDAQAPHAATGSPPLRKGLLSSPLPWLIGLMALFAMVPEGAILEWGALYLRDELGASLTWSGFAFGAFSGVMALMRFTGDGIRSRLGAVLTLRLSTLFAFAGLLMAGSATGPVMAAAGFAVAAIGISNMVPIAFSAAGNLPGLRPGVALSVVTVMGYSGILFAPSFIGFIAEHTGFGPVYLGLSALFIVVALLSGLARHADRLPSGKADSAAARKS